MTYFRAGKPPPGRPPTAALVASIAVALFLSSGFGSAAEQSIGYGARDAGAALQPGEYEAWIFPTGPGDLVSVTLHSTALADFYLTNYSGYLAYKLGQFGTANDFYFIGGECSKVNATGISYLYNPAVDDMLVVIADNQNRTVEGAAPAGPVQITGKIDVRQRFWSLNNILIIGAVVAAAVVLMAWAASRWARAPPEHRPKMVRIVRRARVQKPPERKGLSRKKGMRGR
ncbi:MAG: hypothetical protein HZB92_08055 [Euryarchaeota archaeon]|nr:hypothetical protein [Euryarchaeota archaeon]